MDHASGGRPRGGADPPPEREEWSETRRPEAVGGSETSFDSSAGDEEELLDLVATCLERIDAEGEEVVEELCDAHPEHAQELRQRVELLRKLGLSRPKNSPKPFGRYALMSELGRGGMGVVYLARDEQLGREVALKALAGPLITSERARSRFEREIRAVAQLKHPGIVPIYEVGEADDVPYFTMEYVEGRTLGHVLRSLKRLEVPATDLTTTHLSMASFTASLGEEGAEGAAEDESSESRFTAPPALPEELPPNWGKTYVETVCRFTIQIAEALGHAHAHGVVHRDVKPSNVLIDPRGRALLFDFGLARLESDESLTLTGDFAGTPSYVSPEQARGIAVDHRADVYSLGVTLFELLTLRRPFEGKTAQQVFRQLTSKDPPLPRRFNRLVPRDLETICLTALEKEPGRRYQTAYELASDLRRFLEFRPVLARPAGLSLRTLRFVRRNPAQALAAGLACLLVLGGLFGLFLHNRAIAAERDLALEQYLRAEQSLELWRGMLGSVDPDERGYDVRVRDMLDEAAAEFERDEPLHPLVEAPRREIFGDIYYKLGLFEEAELHLRRALVLYTENSGADSIQTANVKHGLARSLHGLGRLRAAEPLLREALEVYERFYPDDQEAKAVGMSTLGALVADRYGDYERAEELFSEALEMRLRMSNGQPTSGVADNYTHLGKLRALQDDLESALEYHELALAIRKELDGPDHARVAFVLNNQAILMQRLRRVEDAEQLFQRVLQIRLGVMGEVHPEVAQVLDNLASLRRRLGDFLHAEEYARRSLGIVEELFPGDHVEVARRLANLGQILEKRQQLEGAREVLVRAADMHARLPVQHREERALVEMLLGFVLTNQGELDRAAERYRNALAARRSLLPTGHPEIGRAAMMYGEVELSRGELEHAADLLEEGLSIHRRWYPDYADEVVSAKRSLLQLCLARASWSQAEELAEELVEDYCAFDTGQALAAVMMRDLARTLLEQGELARAEQRAREALALQREHLPSLSPELADTQMLLGELLLEDGRPLEAEALLFEALSVLEPHRGRDHESSLVARALYGRVLTETGRAAEAGPYLLDAWARLLAHGATHPRTRDVQELVVAHYANQGAPVPEVLQEPGWLALRHP